MPQWPAFVGPAYTSQSIIAAYDRCVNFYPETLENSGEGRAKAVLYPTPGLQQFAILPTAPVTQLFELNGRLFAVARNFFYEVYSDGTFVARGGVLPSATRPSICSNGTAGHQVFITSGGRGYIFDLVSNAFTQIVSPNFPTGSAVNGQYVDGYFAVQVAGTTQWQISALNDGLTWSGLDVAQRSFAQDNIVALAVTHREVWILGAQTSEVWYNSGATFSFQPITGVFLHEGCGAIDSVGQLGQTIYWLSQNAQGARRVVRAAAGYQPERVSTHAIEYALSGYSTVADATGYGYQDQGHEFYVLTIPSQRATWVFDATTGLWHERGYWDQPLGVYGAQRPVCHAYAFGQHLVGDIGTGQIWSQDIRFTSDGGGPIRRMRTSVHLVDELKYTFYSEAQVDLEVGLADVAATRAPELMLRYSNTGGKTWSNVHTVSAGLVGEYHARARFRKLGRGRDRVFELSMTDAIPWRLINGYIHGEGGTS